MTATDEAIEKMVTTLKDKLKDENIAPGRCTGELAFAALKKAFGARYVYAGLGMSLVFGPDISFNIRRGEAPAFNDLTVYRKLAIRED